MTAALVLGVIALIGVLGLCVFIALRLSETVHRALETVETMQTQYSGHLDKVLDRLMTIRWEDFVSAREFEEGDEVGGFFAPGEADEDGGVEAPDWTGRLKPLRSPTKDEENEERLLREDFK